VQTQPTIITRETNHFLLQITILRRLNHCNIIAMLDSFETDGEFCMVTEYAQGELFQVLEDEHSLPEEEIRKIAIQLIQALHVLHSNRIIHRDMKPQNILIGSKQQIKLCDFGFARAIAHDSSLLRSIKGTPLYMAPELVQERPYNYKVDLWSLGVILYELAVGKPPFYTDRIVSLIQMIVRDEVNYPPTMSADFQSFLKGLLNKDPAQRLNWPEILAHPFVQETPEQLGTRLQLERQVRALPRFFKETELHSTAGEEGEEKLKPSVERLRSCDEWKICDPETGRRVAGPEEPHEDRTSSDLPPSDEGNNRGPLYPSGSTGCLHSVILENFLITWDRINKELDVSHAEAELINAPLFANAVSLLPSITTRELSDEMLGKISALLRLLYRSLVQFLKNADKLTDLAALAHTKDNVHRFLNNMVHGCESLRGGHDRASEVLYRSVRCSTVCTTIVNYAGAGEGQLDYREFCKNDIDTISRVLTCKDSVVATCHAKTLKWLGSMIDRAQNLTTLMEVVSPSGVIQTLCEILHASGISRSPGGRISKGGRDLGLYAVFALAAFAQPDAKCWSPLQQFPVVALVRGAPPMESSSLRDVKHLYKLRVKVHAEVGTHLLSNGVSELIALLGDEINERVRQKQSDGGDTDEEDDIGEEDADQSTICCILKILTHACRSSAPLSKKLTVTKIVFQKHRDTDIFTILRWGIAAGGLHLIEQYFATELLSVILRRGVLLKREIWHCAQTLFPLLLGTSDTALLSALSTFFAEVIESSNMDESALDDSVDPAALEPQDKELWGLLVRGALTPRCSDAIFRLFGSNGAEEEGETGMDGKSQVLTSYNIRAQGLLDSGIVFLLRVASRAAAQPCRRSSTDGGVSRSEEMHMFMSVFEHDRVWAVFDGMMTTGGADLLSPWGLFCFLKLLRLVREMQCNETQVEVAVNEHLLLHLVNLLDLKHIEYLFRWPEVVGGGSNAVKALVHATVKVLGIPFTHTVSEELLVDTQEILYDAKCVQKLLGVLRFVFATRELHLEASVLELPISFLSRLVTSSTHFGSQFVEADGMLVMKECGMLRSSCSPSLIIDTLLIVSQLARSSHTNYSCILSADLLPEFYELMQHPEAMVRAKALNCIGNLCRHSTLFYRHFITPLGGDSSATVLAGVIRGLSDPDSYVRRFACFAIGNAAFHSSDLYDKLRPAIPLLVENLHNDEDKTRSNAGGALGNLVRNSDMLCSDLCTHQAPWEMFELAMTETSTSSRRIVLFSLGNFCVYPECFDFLMEAEPEFVEELEHLYDEVVADEVSRRNIRRVLAKIEALENEAEEESLQDE